MRKTTVIIPNLNGMQYIEACMDSIYKGSVIPEVLVVDNGSTDGSREYVEENYPQAGLIALGHNTGFCKAVNLGITESNTEFVLLLNNDTKVYPDFVAEMENAIEASGRIFSVAAKMINMSEPDKLDNAGDFYCALGWSFARGKDKAVTKYCSPERIFSACGGAALYRKSILEKTGLFDENHFAYLEDVDIGYRANILGFCNVFAPAAKVLHAGSGFSGSRHNSFKVDLSSRNSIYLIYKNMPVLQIVLNLPFLLTGLFIKFLFFSRKKLGIIYVRGLINGLKLAFSKEGKKQKIHFSPRNFDHYIWIQWELWRGLFRRLIG